MTDTYNNRRDREGHVFRPLRVYDPKWKVEIKYAGDTTYTDISSYVSSCTVSHNSRIRLSTGTIKLEDLYGDLYNAISGGEWIRVWDGYTTATKYKEMTARVIRKQMDFQPTTGFQLTLEIRAWPELNSKLFSYTFDNELVESAIGTILAEFDEITYTSPGISTDRISMRFVSSTALTMISEIVTKYGMEFFVDAEGVAHLFYADDNHIEHDAVVLNQNLLSVTELGVDLDRVKNSIKVFGKQEAFVMWLRSARDEASIAQYWQMDDEVFDSAVMTNDDAIDRAQKELAYRKELMEECRMKTMGMENIMPGKQIYLSIPPLVEDWKTIRTVSHTFDGEGWLTEFSIEFDSFDDVSVILERDKQIKGLESIPLDKIYDETIVIDPLNDSSYINLIDLVIESGRIVCTNTAPSSGTFVIRTSFPALTVPRDVVSAIVVVDGENLNKSTFYVSNDANLTELSFENTELGTEQKSFNSINDKMRIRGELVDLDADNEAIVRRIAVYLKFE